MLTHTQEKKRVVRTVLFLDTSLERKNCDLKKNIIIAGKRRNNN